MIYLWETAKKYFESIIGDELSRFIGTYNTSKGPDDVKLNSWVLDGKPWDLSNYELEFSFDANFNELVKFDVLETNSSFIIVNQRVRCILERFAKDDIQFVPVIVRCRDGIINGYYAVNIMSRVAGIDKEKSKCEWLSCMPGEIIGFEVGIGTLVYKHDCLGDHNIAREKEFPFIVISQRLKDALCSMNPPLNDASFVLPEETYW
jgi:hypothetical protein